MFERFTTGPTATILGAVLLVVGGVVVVAGAQIPGTVVAALGGLLVFFALNVERPYAWLATGLLLGGAAGNIIDRLAHGAVTDWVKLPHWPAFNLADVAITAGVITLVVAIDAPRGR